MSSKKKGKSKTKETAESKVSANEPSTTIVLTGLTRLLGKASESVELKIEDLDEKLLKSRLDALDKELARYRSECEYYKKENDWYRNEIDTTERDAADYVRYLESKKAARQDAINQLADAEKRDLDAYKAARAIKERENLARIEDLKQVAADLESKIEAKHTEIAELGDIVARRDQHQTEIAQIHRDMKQAAESHETKILQLEQQMMNERLELQQVADQRVKVMEAAAHEKAILYLHQHYQELEEQNIKMESELRRMAISAQDLLTSKLKLEERNQELAREHRVFLDVSRLRRERAAKDQARRAIKKQQLDREGIVVVSESN
ncbi:hypothetical protein SmJEL517_g03445 [Synchytrium microbalum]|uniref:Uncharacterized protein n=1 Tax=Synchytrium microbalum TaxID=1806994 RepID=A0A507C6L7_9FUNG|nr:uncharacterized protein SmJEL517_g03445 [Synchytrium microbalum]TPX33704.1 hypothetical protein SmJEL517_g03445 [Synchytrium microbalum]